MTDEEPLPHDLVFGAKVLVPSPRRRWTALRVVIVFTLCGLLLWSVLASQFVSSQYGQRIALAIGTAMGLFTALGTWFDPFFAHDTQERADLLNRYPVMKSRGARTLCLSVLATLVTFEAVNGAGLEFWTLATGQSDNWPLHLSAYRSASRANCAGFTLEEAPFTTRRVICVRYPYGEDPSPPGTPVTVWGKASDVGIRVERFEIGDPSYASWKGS